MDKVKLSLSDMIINHVCISKHTAHRDGRPEQLTVRNGPAAIMSKDVEYRNSLHYLDR